MLLDLFSVFGNKPNLPLYLPLDLHFKILSFEIKFKQQSRIFLPQRCIFREFMMIQDAVKTQSGNLKLQAFWANDGWKQTIGDMLSQLTIGSNMNLLGLTSTNLGETDQSYIAQEFFALVVAFCNARIVSMSTWSEPCC